MVCVSFSSWINFCGVKKWRFYAFVSHCGSVKWWKIGNWRQFSSEIKFYEIFIKSFGFNKFKKVYLTSFIFSLFYHKNWITQKWPRTHKYLLFNHTKDRNWKFSQALNFHIGHAMNVLISAKGKLFLRDFFKVFPFHPRFSDILWDFFNKSGRCSIDREIFFTTFSSSSFSHRLKEFIQKYLLPFTCSDWKHFHFCLFPVKNVFGKFWRSFGGAVRFFFCRKASKSFLSSLWKKLWEKFW